MTVGAGSGIAEYDESMQTLPLHMPNLEPKTPGNDISLQDRADSPGMVFEL